MFLVWFIYTGLFLLLFLVIYFLVTFVLSFSYLGPGRFPGIARNAGNHGMMENFTKVTKYLPKYKERLINYVWEISRQKAIRIKFS